MAARLLTEADEQLVVAAIAAAEKATSGEIRIHLEDHCRGNALDRAIQLFDKLGMTRTVARNGVIVYIAVKDHKLAIYGDAGIHEQVGSDFWQAELNALIAAFKAGNYAAGLVQVVTDVGDKLKTYFPYQSDDSNELSNDISYGKD